MIGDKYIVKSDCQISRFKLKHGDILTETGTYNFETEEYEDGGEYNDLRKGTTNASIITVMPLTHIIKKQHLPVHGCLQAESETGLSMYSMILGEQPQTICKAEVIKKLGNVTDKKQRNNVNKVCFNTFSLEK